MFSKRKWETQKSIWMEFGFGIDEKDDFDESTL